MMPASMSLTYEPGGGAGGMEDVHVRTSLMARAAIRATNSSRQDRRWTFAFVVVFAGLASACNLSPYEIGGGGGDDIIDASVDRDAIDADTTRIDAGEFDAMPDACTPFPERCNGIDDDCNNNIDEGFDLTADPANCGTCGTRCFQPNAAGTCVASDCEYACLPGFVDTDMPANLEDGCEYLCTPSNGGVEVCDEADNDCDTNFDEGLGLESDVNNCGSCGNRCVALNATATCTASTCGFGACDAGFKDLDPAIAGCEYQCPGAETTETCNGVDDDCDGVVDDNVSGLNQPCADPGFFPTPGGTGACTLGTTTCNFGVVVCQNYERPATEVCDDTHVGDERDEDCDGVNDDGFDKQNDPRHCGTCAPCDVDNAIAGCELGLCTVAQCLPGFVDENGTPGDGCEYACTPSGPEQCDGVDNDCDRLFDLDDPDLALPPTSFCRSAGTCSGATITCQADGCGGPVTWQCNYGTDSEQGAFTPAGNCGVLPLEEARCDGLDGDCDAQIDESYEPAKGSACTDAEVGACQGTGDLRCNAAGNRLDCVITAPNADPLDPTLTEACNDIDDDCDGVIDDGAPDEMVQVVNGATTYYVYKYEASRPDAQAGAFGQASHRSCSKPGVLPWRSVTQTEAAAACAATGKRLCTEAEWQYSCEGPTPLQDYPYSNTYQPLACNGRDFDIDCATPDSDAVQPTGYAYGDTNTSLAGCQSPATTACVSREEAVDLSGNLREWTSTAVGSTAFRVKGGGFDTIKQGLTCDFSFLAFAPDVELPNLGFRCCSSTP